MILASEFNTILILFNYDYVDDGYWSLHKTFNFRNSKKIYISEYLFQFALSTTTDTHITSKLNSRFSRTPCFMERCKHRDPLCLHAW